MVRHYHVAHQGKTVPLAIELQFLRQYSAAFLILEVGMAFKCPRGDKVSVRVIIEPGEILMRYDLPPSFATSSTRGTWGRSGDVSRPTPLTDNHVPAP